MWRAKKRGEIVGPGAESARTETAFQPLLVFAGGFWRGCFPRVSEACVAACMQRCGGAHHPDVAPLLELTSGAASVLDFQVVSLCGFTPVTLPDPLPGSLVTWHSQVRQPEADACGCLCLCGELLWGRPRRRPAHRNPSVLHIL